MQIEVYEYIWNRRVNDVHEYLLIIVLCNK